MGVVFPREPALRSEASPSALTLSPGLYGSSLMGDRQELARHYEDWPN
jgi:hypothetical protein